VAPASPASSSVQGHQAQQPAMPSQQLSQQAIQHTQQGPHRCKMAAASAAKGCSTKAVDALGTRLLFLCLSCCSKQLPTPRQQPLQQQTGQLPGVGSLTGQQQPPEQHKGAAAALHHAGSGQPGGRQSRACWQQQGTLGQLPTGQQGAANAFTGSSTSTAAAAAAASTAPVWAQQQQHLQAQLGAARLPVLFQDQCWVLTINRRSTPQAINTGS